LLSAALWTIAAGQSADVLAGGGIDSSFEAWNGSGFAGWSISGGSLAVAGPAPAVPPARRIARARSAPMPHTLLLAEPRGFCAGVVRAIDVLDRVLDDEDSAVYAFHEIVHNRYVVERFEQRGAIFVNSISEIPEGSRVIFSAHGVSPAVVAEAERRKLRVVDATCPLVTKVHLETRKAAKDGYDILLVGHRGHDEIEGTAGEAPNRATVVETPEEAATLDRRTRPIFVVTQTTLSVDDTASTIESIRESYPAAEVRNDICYATTNRQAAVRELAERAGVVIVVGSSNSSNTVRLREVAAGMGTPAYRVDGVDEIDPVWYDGVDVVGLTAGASVPDELLTPIIEDLRSRGVTTVEPVIVAEETVIFQPPEEMDSPAG
jgi:4-hydroxy-3-methylbut-2-enyl diphosphate reductase